jgi:acetyl-CoA C-acetyltransferase
MTEAWIIDGTRSPSGKGKANGSLQHVHTQDVLAQVLNALAVAGAEPVIMLTAPVRRRASASGAPA